MSNDTPSRVPSGFPMLDLLTGGYPSGGLTVVRFLGHEIQAGIAQQFIERQALNFSVPHGGKTLRTLLATLQMDAKELARSLCMEKYVSIEKMMQANLYVNALNEKKPKRTADEFLKEIEEQLAEFHPDVLIIDAVDELIPEPEPTSGNNPVSRIIDRAFRPDPSAVVTGTLLHIAADAGIPVIVTDYGNRLNVMPAIDRDVKNIELVEDVNGTTQATVIEAGRVSVINDVYASSQTYGTALILAAVSSYEANGRFLDAPDQILALANAGAAIAMQIDDLLKTIQQ